MELNDYFQDLWYRYKLRQLCQSADKWKRAIGNFGLAADSCVQAFKRLVGAFRLLHWNTRGRRIIQ